MGRISLALLPIIGAILSRLHGGGFRGGVNKTLKNFLWALPFCIIIGLLNPWLAPLGLLCMLKGTGHGRGLGADEPFNNDAKPEKVEHVLLWLKPSLTDRAYKYVIMAATGFMAVSGGVIAFAFINPLSAVIISIGGLLKGQAYEIGARLLPNQNKSGIPHIQYKTEVGEFLTGFFAYTGLVIGFIIA